MPTTKSPTGSAADPLAVALGYKNWNYGPWLTIGGAAPGTQKIFASGLWLPAGTLCTGAVIDVQVAGTSTAPTGVFFGLADTSAVRAQTANVGSDAKLTSLGMKQFDFSATYTTTYSGLYYVLILKNGAFAGTDVSFGHPGAPLQGNALSGGAIPYGNIGTGQATLPSNGTAITLVADSRCFRVGIY